MLRIGVLVGGEFGVEETAHVHRHGVFLEHATSLHIVLSWGGPVNQMQRTSIVTQLVTHWTTITLSVSLRRPLSCTPLVARAGIEPATFRFSGERSYRLSYLALLTRTLRGPDGI